MPKFEYANGRRGMRRRRAILRICKWTFVGLTVALAAVWGSSFRWWLFRMDAKAIFTIQSGVIWAQWGDQAPSGAWRGPTCWFFAGPEPGTRGPGLFTKLEWWLSAMGGWIKVPLWLPTGLAAFATALCFLVDRRAPRGGCPTCGYDLTGNVSGTCPECGTAIRLRP